MALFTNSASLSYLGRVASSNTVTGEILETLSVTKTAVGESYSPGGDVSYAVSLVNSGTEALTGLTLSDDLGAYQYQGVTVTPLAYQPGSLLFFLNGVLQPTPTVDAGPPLTVTGLSVPAGGNAMLVYETNVTAFASPAAGGSIVNTVTVTGGLAAPLTDTATLPAAEAAELSVNKSLSPLAVAPNGTVTYTFTLENSGNSPVEAADGAILSDTFDPLLTNLTVALNGAAWTQGVNYSYDPDIGAFATLTGQLPVPAATFTQNEDGSWSTTPGTAVLTVSGKLSPANEKI